MKRYLTLLLSVIVMLGLMSGCTKDDDDDNGTGPELTTFEKLTTYMSEQSLDLPDVLTGWLIGASTLVGNEDDYFVVDIRSEALYNAGHIPGAHNASLADIVDYVSVHNTEMKPVVIACYTGQSACRAVVALRMSGYSDAASLGFGMSSWHSSLDSWSGNTGSIAVGHSNWSTDAAPDLPTFTEEPTITTTATEGADILAAQVEYMLNKSGWGINASDVLDAPNTFTIFNYWGATDYDTYGHIAGAYQLTPGALTIANDGLAVMDPVGTNVIYCWTGQTSSMVTAWLDLLGYDAKSLKFGANGMIYDELTGHKWAGSADYTLETGE